MDTPSKDSKKVPPLNLMGSGGAPMSQMTSREEQEQYKLKGMQDGKVEELLEHERRETRKILYKKATKKVAEPEEGAKVEKE